MGLVLLFGPIHDEPLRRSVGAGLSLEPHRRPGESGLMEVSLRVLPVCGAPGCRGEGMRNVLAGFGRGVVVPIGRWNAPGQLAPTDMQRVLQAQRTQAGTKAGWSP